MKHKLALLAGTHLATLSLGYSMAPKETLDREVRQTGLFQRDTMETLSATVSSLSSENIKVVVRFAST